MLNPTNSIDSHRNDDSVSGSEGSEELDSIEQERENFNSDFEADSRRNDMEEEYDDFVLDNDESLLEENDIPASPNRSIGTHSDDSNSAQLLSDNEDEERCQECNSSLLEQRLSPHSGFCSRKCCRLYSLRTEPCRSIYGGTRYSGLVDTSDELNWSVSDEQSSDSDVSSSSSASSEASVEINPENEDEQTDFHTKNPYSWSCEEVAVWITEITNSEEIGSLFRDEEVDMRSLFLMLESDEGITDILTDYMHLKLGPVLKIKKAVSVLKNSATQG